MMNLARPDMNEAEFSSIRRLVFENTGISLAPSKKELAKRRFTPRLRELGISSFAAYVKHVKNNQEREMTKFCNAITTNLTSFFRENHHYEFLNEVALPIILRRNDLTGRKLRLWSAGCSTGQEAYCLAMTLRNCIPAIDGWDAKILASDLDEVCLEEAKNGVYPQRSFKKMSDDLVSKYFTKTDEVGKQKNGGLLQAKPELKQMIHFNKLNLMDSCWPMRGNFDVIFCRNVFIYFDKDTQSELVKRFSKLQNPGSYLCLGHSETIDNPTATAYKLIGKTTYIRE